METEIKISAQTVKQQALFAEGNTSVNSLPPVPGSRRLPPLPGNDDALRAIRLFTSKVADAVMEGRQIAKDRALEEERLATEAAYEESGVEPGYEPAPDRYSVAVDAPEASEPHDTSELPASRETS